MCKIENKWDAGVEEVLRLTSVSSHVNECLDQNVLRLSPRFVTPASPMSFHPKTIAVISPSYALTSCHRCCQICRCCRCCLAHSRPCRRRIGHDLRSQDHCHSWPARSWSAIGLKVETHRVVQHTFADWMRAASPLFICPDIL